MHALQRIRHRHAAGSLLGWSLRLRGGTTVAADCGRVYAWRHRVRCGATVPACGPDPQLRSQSWVSVRAESLQSAAPLARCAFMGVGGAPAGEWLPGARGVRRGGHDRCPACLPCSGAVGRSCRAVSVMATVVLLGSGSVGERGDDRGELIEDLLEGCRNAVLLFLACGGIVARVRQLGLAVAVLLESNFVDISCTVFVG